jgi:hypothetical protein
MLAACCNDVTITFSFQQLLHLLLQLGLAIQSQQLEHIILQSRCIRTFLVINKEKIFGNEKEQSSSGKHRCCFQCCFRCCYSCCCLSSCCFEAVGGGGGGGGAVH